MIFEVTAVFLSAKSLIIEGIYLLDLLNNALKVHDTRVAAELRAQKRRERDDQESKHVFEPYNGDNCSHTCFEGFESTSWRA